MRISRDYCDCRQYISSGAGCNHLIEQMIVEYSRDIDKYSRIFSGILRLSSSNNIKLGHEQSSFSTNNECKKSYLFRKN